MNLEEIIIIAELLANMTALKEVNHRGWSNALI